MACFSIACDFCTLRRSIDVKHACAQVLGQSGECLSVRYQVIDAGMLQTGGQADWPIASVRGMCGEHGGGGED